MTIEQIRRLMRENGRKADELYQKAVDDQCEGLPNPTVWIYNQDAMRSSWEKYKGQDNNLLRQFMMNNTFAEYMEFMYENWPAGFGNACRLSYEMGQDFDGAKTYQRLTQETKKMI